MIVLFFLGFNNPLRNNTVILIKLGDAQMRLFRKHAMRLTSDFGSPKGPLFGPSESFRVLQHPDSDRRCPNEAEGNLGECTSEFAEGLK